MAAKIDVEVKKIAESAYKKANGYSSKSSLISFDVLAEELLKKEKLRQMNL